jgi:hypothetical protein
VNQIHDALSQLLSKKLERHLQTSLDKAAFISIYTDVYETILEVFQNAKIDISNEGVNLIAQMYYDSVKINNSQELDPNIFSQRAKLENIETKELAMLATMFNGTPFGDIFVYAVKRRS